MEIMEINSNFWNRRSVFLTGHTGFKGGWLALWLTELGANVNGYSLEVKSNPNFFSETNLEEKLSSSVINDIENFEPLAKALLLAKPSVVIHMAAQPLVRASYNLPVKTFKTNVIGTVNLLEACRKVSSVEAILIITSDKCYENKENMNSYSENDRLGGFDPYSSSKACAEIVTSAYRNSFLKEIGIKIATTRAGNVIGGGDWSTDRLIPDIFRASVSNKELIIRNPNAIRPWQHVLEPLSGYLILAEKLVTDSDNFSGAWNFGSHKKDSKKVSWIIDYFSKKIPIKWNIDSKQHLHEANLLLLDSSKARLKLGWKPRWSIKKALDETLDWHKAWQEKQNLANVSINQINSYYRKSF